MERVNLEVGPAPKIVVETLGGDLRFAGREGAILEAQAPDQGGLQLERTEGGARLACRSSCLVFAPSGASLEGGEVGGDVRIADLEGALLLSRVGGDLSLRRVGRASFETVGGDLHARELSGNLTADVVGGDALALEVEGDLRLRSVGGDLFLRGVRGTVDCQAGGDAMLTLRPQPGSNSCIRAGGDLSLELPREASVRLRLQAGGELHLPAGVAAVPEEDGVWVELGSGEAELDVRAGGDMVLRLGSPEKDPPGFFVGDILGEVEAKLAEMEAHFSAMGAGLYGIDAERIGERVRRAVRKARRKASHRPRSRSAHAGRWRTGAGRPSRGMPPPASQELSEEERLTVLRMVEQGKISVEEAERLLAALEGEL